MLKIWDIINWEQIKLAIKKHAFMHIFLWILLFFVSVITISILYFYKTSLITYFWIIVFWQFFLVLLYFYIITRESDILIITQTKILIIRKISFLNREFVEYNLKEIKEVKANVKWLFENTFHYWSLYIVMKNNNTIFHLEYIPDVINNAKTIITLIK